MKELDLVTDMVEEQISKGNLRWLANFKEIRRDFQLEDLKIPIYASGGLEERGFLLSRLYSAFVTPKYGVHFLLVTSSESDEKFLRKLITVCKRKFKEDDWIFLSLVQSGPIGKSVKNAIENLSDPHIGVVIYSLSTKEEAWSNNVLGKGLKKQLKLTEARFEAIDIPDYVKSFTIMFFFITVMALTAQWFFRITLFNFPAIPVTIMIILALSIIGGHLLYKSQYHAVIIMNEKGFEMLRGKSATKRKWADFKDVTIYISPKHETCIRLYGDKETIEIPVSHMGLSRKEAYYFIKGIINKKL